jgi:hypothetical protein
LSCGEILARPRSRLRFPHDLEPPSRPFVSTFLRGGLSRFASTPTSSRNRHPQVRAGALSERSLPRIAALERNARLPQVDAAQLIMWLARARCSGKRLQRDCVGETLLAVRVCSRLRPPTDNYGSNIGRCNLGSARLHTGRARAIEHEQFLCPANRHSEEAQCAIGAHRPQARTLGG